MQQMTEVSIDQKLIDRIQKLLALATSPNEHEAKAAASKAQELLIRHNLSTDAVEKSTLKFHLLTHTVGICLKDLIV